MNLADQLRALQSRRAELAEEMAEIDQQLSEVREILGVSVLPSAAVPESSGRMDTIPLCERCGEPFARTQGSSGRFCSRACYQGELSIDDRRAAILEALKSGPRWATRLRVGVLASVTNGTIHNDLAYLRKQGLVENGDDGWQLVATSEPEASPVPLAQSRETPATFPTSRPSNWH